MAKYIAHKGLKGREFYADSVEILAPDGTRVVMRLNVLDDSVSVSVHGGGNMTIVPMDTHTIAVSRISR